MYFCDDCDIAYERARGSRVCPICEAKNDIENLEKEIVELNEELEKAKTKKI